MRIKRGFTLPILLLVVVASLIGVAGPASADGGDFSLDFIAAGPLSYNHDTGVGGEFGDRTIDKEHVVESLEGGDFECGELVVYFTEITVDAGATGVQDIELDFEFLAEPTGQPGVGHSDLVSATPNDGDSANTAEADDTTVSIEAEQLDLGANPHGILSATIGIANLDPGETFILRLAVRLSCIFGSSPTGNLQGDIVDARVTAPEADTISVGNQTIPFKNIDQVLKPGSVDISVGECPEPGSPTVPVTVTIDPEGSATVTIEGPGDPHVVTGSGDVLDLAPGNYTWSAEAEAGFELTGDTSGEFTVQDCPKTPAAVEIEVGACPEPGSPTVPVTITIDPDSSATVTIEGPGGAQYVVTETDTLDLPPGDYTWSAEADPTFELEVDKGEFTVQECPFLPASVTIEVGECPAPGAATVPVTVTIDPAGSATVTIEGPGGPYEVTESGAIDLPSGSYTWSAEAAPTYELDVAAGEFTVPDCPEVLASVIVTVTPCPEGATSTTANVTIDPAGAANVTVTGTKGFEQTITSADATLELQPDAYSWVAVANPTYELIGDTSGEFSIACVLAQTGVDVTDLGLLGLAVAMLGVGMVRFGNEKRNHVALATRLSGRSDWDVFFALALFSRPLSVRRRQHR